MISLLKKTLICCFALAAIVGCSEKIVYLDKDIPEINNIRVLITSEGQYGLGTASLTAITHDGYLKQDVFKSVNNRTMGDVAQSLTEIGDNFYVTLNNSRKIEVFNKKTFKSVETILMPEASIPGYIADIGGGKIAITEKGQYGVLIIANALNNSDETIKPIKGIGSAFQMKVINDKLFIAGGSLRVFDLDNITLDGMRKVKDSNDKTFGVSGDSKIIVDKNGNLWVIGSGSRLICIDPKTEKVIKEIKGISTFYYPRLDIDPNGEDLYFTGKKGMVKFNINDEAAPSEIAFEYPEELRTLYCMSISYEGTIFICDAQFGSLSRGNVFELSTEGELINKFEAGIFPGYIHFMKK